jgi:hypothetical protein
MNLVRPSHRDHSIPFSHSKNARVSQPLVWMRQRQPLVFPAVGPFNILCLIKKKFALMWRIWYHGFLGKKTFFIDHLIVGDLLVKGTGKDFVPVIQWWSPKLTFVPPHIVSSENKIWPKSVRKQLVSPFVGSSSSIHFST